MFHKDGSPRDIYKLALWTILTHCGAIELQAWEKKVPATATKWFYWVKKAQIKKTGGTKKLEFGVDFFFFLDTIFIAILCIMYVFDAFLVISC